MDLETGEKLKKLGESEIPNMNCDLKFGDLCLNNLTTELEDGGYRGFDIYDINTSEIIFSNPEGASDRAYLYKDLIIFSECTKKVPNPDSRYDKCLFTMQAYRIKEI